MTRIRAITLRASTADIRRAMYAACAPFGSLDSGIADRAIAYLSDGCTLEAGITLLRETRAIDGEWSEVLLGGSRVQLITPASPAEELAGTVLGDRAVAERVSDLGEIEPASTR